MLLLVELVELSEDAEVDVDDAPRPPERVSRSTVTTASKCVQLLRSSFGETRFEIGCAHSNWLLVSNHVHCAQVWKSAVHLEHWLSNRIEAESAAPQRAHFVTSRKLGMLTFRGSRGP